MKTFLVLMLLCLFTVSGCLRTIPANPMDWEVADVKTQRLTKSYIFQVMGIYNGNARDLEIKFDSVFRLYFRKYSPSILSKTSVGENVHILAAALYGDFEVQALLVIQPDKTYVLKIASASPKHNGRWAYNLKSRIDRR